MQTGKEKELIEQVKEVFGTDKNIDLNTYNFSKDNVLDDYETVHLFTDVSVRNRWWKFWLPKSISCYCGVHTKIGNKVLISLKDRNILTKK